MTHKIDPNERLMLEQVSELCALCARGIVKISDDTHIHPQQVAKMFFETFQTVLKKLDES